jgi:hypothetical protein
MKKFLTTALALFLVISFFTGCKNEYPPSLWDPGKEYRPNPAITSVEPDSAYAGIGEVTIKGDSFAVSVDSNHVYFDGIEATILSATATQLTVLAPNVPGDSLRIKLRIDGALLYDEYYPYKLTRAAIEYGGFSDVDDAWGIACDKDENLYVSLAGKKIVKVTPDGEQQDYANTSFDKASGMKMGPEGYIYYVNLLSFMFRVLPGGGPIDATPDDELFAMLPGGTTDLDFGPSGNIYCGGSGAAIYRVKPDKSKEKAADYKSISIKTVRVFNGYVYVGGDSSGHQCIWRNQIISADSLGPKEIYFDWSNEIGPTSKVLSITFATDGDMYVGTDATEAIIIVHPDGSNEALYPGVLEPESYALCWGNGQYLYVNRQSTDAAKKRIIRVNTLDKEGAPYYGRE